MTQKNAADPQFLQFVARTTALLLGGDEPSAQAPSLIPLAGDGSRRRIYRLRHADLRAVAIANPLPADREHPDENEAFLAVREYLDRRRIRVPRFYAADLEQGFLLLEDLGDERLYDRVVSLRRPPRGPGGTEDEPDGAVHSHRGGREVQRDEGDAPREHVQESELGDLEPLYNQALSVLIRMQAPRDPVFRSSWTSNPPYSSAFIVEQEAGYFHRELVLTATGWNAPFEDIEAECDRLAHLALGGHRGTGATGRLKATDHAWAEERVFMHRDFQSRNLMLAGDELAVIDFQGARLGPPGYDVAALLYDPYVQLRRVLRRRLAEFYYDQARGAGVPAVAGMTGQEWRGHLLANAANRLLQALGAFAKLGIREARAGFREHIPSGLALLAEVLEELGEAPKLHKLVCKLGERFGEVDPPGGKHPSNGSQERS